MEVLAYKPSRYWRLDSTSPFIDSTGYAGSAVRTGAEVKGVGLVSNASFSQILDSTHTITFDSPVYRAGREANPFTLMAVVFPVQRTTSGDQQILSNSARYDGLSINGTVISFSTQYVSNGSATCSYDLTYYRKAIVVGVHTRTKNSLYVNGRLVSEVDISAAQQADIFDAPDANLYSGLTTSTQGLMLNAVATFGTALSATDIAALYTSLNRRFSGSVPRAFGGMDLPLVWTPFLDDRGFELGVFNNTSLSGSQLIPDTYNGLSFAGTWERTYNISDAGTNTPIQSANIQWEGKGATVSTSVNGGTTWVDTTPGTALTNLPSGFNPTGKDLMVRVTFAEGSTDAYVDNFKVSVFNSNTYTPLVGRSITYSNAVLFDDWLPLELRENWGVKLASGGTIAFGGDSSQDTYVARTIEVWMKRNSTTNPTYSFSPTTTYVNGISGGSAGRGEWAVYHFVLPGNLSSFSISGNVSIGRVSIYNTALSAGTVSSIYTNYTGLQSTTAPDSSTIDISEPASSALIYAHDWSILSS